MNDTTFGTGWLPVLVILLVLFGMGGGGFGVGNNAAIDDTMNIPKERRANI